MESSFENKQVIMLRKRKYVVEKWPVRVKEEPITAEQKRAEGALKKFADAKDRMQHLLNKGRCLHCKDRAPGFFYNPENDEPTWGYDERCHNLMALSLEELLQKAEETKQEVDNEAIKVKSMTEEYLECKSKLDDILWTIKANHTAAK